MEHRVSVSVRVMVGEITTCWSIFKASRQPESGVKG
jgi:hypothetical protein